MMQQSMGAAPMSDSDWQKHLQNVELNSQREQQARDQATKLGQSTYDWTGVEGTKGFGVLGQQSGNQNSAGGSSGGNSSGSTSLFGSSSSGGGLFGSGGGLNDYINAAKDMSDFQLGQNEKMGQFNLGLRNQEADSNFGRQTKLESQQIQGTYDLNRMQQDATTSRLQSQLQNESSMQQKGFDEQNLFRAQSAALAMRGLQ